jgi:hypothetical protein
VRALAGGVMGGAQLVGRWVESYTGMSPDNIKGLLLALSSSLFIFYRHCSVIVVSHCGGQEW